MTEQTNLWREKPPELRRFMVREDGRRMEYVDAKVGDRVWIYEADGEPIHSDNGCLFTIEEIAHADQQAFGWTVKGWVTPGTENTAPSQAGRPESDELAYAAHNHVSLAVEDDGDLVLCTLPDGRWYRFPRLWYYYLRRESPPNEGSNGEPL